MPDYKTKIAANIRYYAALHDMQLGELAEKSGISNQSLSALLNSPGDFKFGTLISVANALSVTPTELLK
jgi:DNA-binding Xre family transcriptional regulator